MRRPASLRAENFSSMEIAMIGTPGQSAHFAVGSPFSYRRSSTGLTPRAYAARTPFEKPARKPRRPSVAFRTDSDFAIQTEVTEELIMVASGIPRAWSAEEDNETKRPRCSLVEV